MHKNNLKTILATIILSTTISGKTPAQSPTITRTQNHCINRPLINQTEIWSQTRQRTAWQNAHKHYQKHKTEFPNTNSTQDYVIKAHLFTKNPPQNTQFKLDARDKGRLQDRDILYYHEASNTFLIVTAPSGATNHNTCVPRTMFKPSNGKKYWQKQ